MKYHNVFFGRPEVNLPRRERSTTPPDFSNRQVSTPVGLRADLGSATRKGVHVLLLPEPRSVRHSLPPSICRLPLVFFRNLSDVLHFLHSSSPKEHKLKKRAPEPKGFSSAIYQTFHEQKNQQCPDATNLAHRHNKTAVLINLRMFTK
jgi:hypothetical protein